MYDHGARNRNPVSTLWYGIDPLFEKYLDFSPYNYCAGNPVKFIDPDGKIIKLPKGTSKADIMVILKNLQKLTDDKLVYSTQKNGSVRIKISKLGSGNKTYGTRLIRRINSSKYTMIINSIKNEGNSETDVNSGNATNGKGTDVDVYFNSNSNPDILTLNPKTGRVSGKKRPSYIGLAHEMIHGDRSMRGVAIPYGEMDTQTYTDISGKKVIEPVIKEEAATVGLGFNKKGDITENQIRKEHKLNKRGAY